MEDELKRILGTARLVHIANVVAVFIYIIVIYIAVEMAHVRIFPPGSSALRMLEAVLALLAGIALLIAYFSPRWWVSWYRGRPAALLAFHVVRITSLEAMGVFGLVLGIAGAGWAVSLAFIIVSAVTLIIIIPTEQKWLKMLKPDDPGS